MITLPVRRSRTDDTNRRTRARDVPGEYGSSVPVSETIPEKEVQRKPKNRHLLSASEVPRQAPLHRKVPAPEPVTEEDDHRIPEALAPSRRRVIVAHAEKERTHHPSSHTLSAYGSPRTGYKTGVSDRSLAETPVRHPDEEIPRTKETERQRIERELRRQRTIAMSGQSQKIPPPTTKNHEAAQEKHIIQRSAHRDLTGSEDQTRERVNEPAAVSGEKRTIIVGKRKIITMPQEEQDPRPAWRERHPHGRNPASYPDESSSLSDDEEMSVEIRDTVFRARDEVFEGKGVRKPIPATGTGFHPPPYRTPIKEKVI